MVCAGWNEHGHREVAVIIRKAGTILVGVGFVLVALAALIRDPVALDANIGAGVLLLVGIPVGAFGLAMTIGGAVYESLSKRARRPLRYRRG
jgi:hypothetical protein